MVNPLRRMRKLNTALSQIRVGPGAAVLPRNVTKIEMKFAARIEGGHMGPRKFWRNELKRLKYHNPAVAMTVERTDLASDPAIMAVHFGTPAGTDSESAGEARVEQINMKHFTNTEILDALMKLTHAEPVEPSPEDIELIERLQEQEIRSEKDKKLSAEVRAKAKREAELLAQAKGEITTN